MSEIEYETVLVKVDSVTWVSKQVPKGQPRPAPEQEADALAALLEGNIPSIEAALPSLSDDDLARLLSLEQDGQARKGAIGAIEEAQLSRLPEDPAAE